MNTHTPTYGDGGSVLIGDPGSSGVDPYTVDIGGGGGDEYDAPPRPA